MADRKIEIEILAKGKPAEKGIDSVKKKTKELDTQVESSGKKMTASWVKVGVAVAGLTLAFKKLSDAYAVQLKAEIALQNALRINARAGDASLNVWKEYASALQDVTLYGDEATLQQIALIKTMGLSDEQTKKVIETAMDYATAFGKDLPSAVRELTMTLSGQIGTIKRTIPAIGDYTKEQLQAGVVIDAVADKVRGQAKAIADTPWGKSQQLANSFGDEMERLGKAVLDVSAESGALGMLSNILSKISDGLDRATQRFQYLKGEMSDQERLKFLQSELSLIGDISQIEEQWKALGLQQDKQKLDYARQLIKEINQTRDAILNNKDAEKDAMEETIIQRQKELDLQTQLNEQSEDYFGLINTGFQDYAEAINDPMNKMKELESIGSKVAKGIEDAFVEMAMTGEVSFEKMANAIIADLIRIQVRQRIVVPLSGMLDNMFTSHTGTTEVKHTGGMIGIPSYHSGMRSDERLAKLQVGEAVINRAGASRNRDAIDAMNAGYAVGGGSGVSQTANITFNVQAFDTASFQQGMVENRATIVGVVREAFNRNGQAVKI